MHLVIWIALAVVAVLVAARASACSRARRRPTSACSDGKLKPPAEDAQQRAAARPTCGPMRAQKDEYARIAPIAVQGDGKATIAKIAKVVEDLPGSHLVEQRDDYLYAQFTTPLMRFVDDVEFWFDPAAGVVQVRSASRVGRKDFGVNRARIENIRARLGPA